MFSRDYADVFSEDERWQNLPTPTEDVRLDAESTASKASMHDGMSADPSPVTDIHAARVLAKLGDSVTTDHISPPSSISSLPAGLYLQRRRDRRDFNSWIAPQQQRS